jgi:hypothetical protein
MCLLPFDVSAARRGDGSGEQHRSRLTHQFLECVERPQPPVSGALVRFRRCNLAAAAGFKLLHASFEQLKSVRQDGDRVRYNCHGPESTALRTYGEARKPVSPGRNGMAPSAKVRLCAAIPMASEISEVRMCSAIDQPLTRCEKQSMTAGLVLSLAGYVHHDDRAPLRGGRHNGANPLPTGYGR